MTAAIIRQGWRFLLVGVFVYATDLLTYTILARLLPDGFLFANAVGKLTGAALGFAMHKRFTFAGEQRDRTGRQLAVYLALLTMNLALSTALLWLAVAQFGFDEIAIRIVIDAIIVATSFLGMRLLVYRSL